MAAPRRKTEEADLFFKQATPNTTKGFV